MTQVVRFPVDRRKRRCAASDHYSGKKKKRRQHLKTIYNHTYGLLYLLLNTYINEYKTHVSYSKHKIHEQIEILNCKDKGKGKGKFLPITGHEGPEGQQMYSCTLSLTSALDGSGWSTPRPGLFTPGKDPVPIV